MSDINLLRIAFIKYLQNKNEKENRFLVLIILSIMLAYSPVKSLMLGYPFIFYFLFLFFVPSHSISNLLRIMAFSIFYFIACFFYSLINIDFLWANAILFFITISPIFIFFLKIGIKITNRFLVRLSKTIAIWISIQGVIGICQLFYGFIFITHSFDSSNGDFATGTITLPIGIAGSGSNQVYAILQSGLFITVFVFAEKKYFKSKMLYLTVVLLSWLGASVMHSIMFWIGGLITTVIYFYVLNNSAKQNSGNVDMKKYALLGFFTFFLVIVILPGNLNLAKGYFTQTFLLSEANYPSPKAIATLDTVLGLSAKKEYQPWVGLGPGQYSSRAGLILSGEYLTGVSIQNYEVSPDLDQFILPIWRSYKNASFQAGSTHFPFYSWLSLYGEFGLLGVLILLRIAYVAVRYFKTHLIKENPNIGLGMTMLIFYLLFLGFQDNYWEWSQAVFPIFLMIKIGHTFIKQDISDSNDHVSPN